MSRRDGKLVSEQIRVVLFQIVTDATEKIAHSNVMKSGREDGQEESV